MDTRMSRRAVVAVTAMFVSTGWAGSLHAQTRLPEVVVWVQSGPEADAIKKTAEAYTKETGNPVTIGMQGRAGWRQRYETALAAGGKEFDAVLHISRFVPALAAGGLLAPLDEYIAKSPDYNVADIPVAIQDEMKFGGKWYMAPTDITLETLVYRTDLIPTPPKTWDELRTTALKFTQSQNPSSPTRYGYAYAATPGNLMTAWYGTMGSYGASILDEKSCPGVDTPKATEAWKLFVDLKNVDKATPPDINAWDYPELLTALQNGTVAQANFFTAGMPLLLDCAQSPKVCNNIALVAQPAGPAGSKTRVNPLGMMVNASSDKKDATWAFLRWATGPVGGKVYNAAGGASPRISILSDPALAKERPWTPEMLKAAQNGVGNVRHPLARELGEAFDRYAQQAVAGQTAPDASLKSIGTEMRQILGNPAACR